MKQWPLTTTLVEGEINVEYECLDVEDNTYPN